MMVELVKFPLVKVIIDEVSKTVLPEYNVLQDYSVGRNSECGASQ